MTADEISAAVRALADQVVTDIRKEGRPCARVHLKVRFVPFFTFTKVRKLAEPTYDAAVIAETALELLAKLDDDRPIRLLGVRAEMIPPEGGYWPAASGGGGGGSARSCWGSRCRLSVIPPRRR